MPIWVTVQLVVLGVVLLAFGYRSTGGALRFLTGSFALIVAIVGSVGAIGLFWLGHKAHWTSDGPGMLFVMIAIGLCLFAAFVGWVFVFALATSSKAPVRSLPSVSPEVRRLLRLAGFALFAIAAVGEVVALVGGRGRTPHEFPVVAVAFGRDRMTLVSVDAQGVVVDWSLHSKREVGRITIPELSGVTEAFLDVSGVGYAIANGRAVRFTRVARQPVRTIPDARHVARGAALVIARERALVFVSYFNDWTKPPEEEIAWPETITAIAGIPGRDGHVAVADRASVSLLDGRPGHIRTLASVPAPGPITRLAVLPDWKVLALGGSGGGWLIDMYRRVTQPLAIEASLLGTGGRTLLVSGREIAEYDAGTKTAKHVAGIRSGTLSVDTWEQVVALGFERGDVVLGTFRGGKLETERLTSSGSGD